MGFVEMLAESKGISGEVSILMSETGEYSDWITWVVMAYSDPKEARRVERHCNRLIRAYNKIFLKGRVWDQPVDERVTNMYLKAFSLLQKQLPGEYKTSTLDSPYPGVYTIDHSFSVHEVNIV